MSKGSRPSNGQGVTRRGFTAGALGTGLILGTGRAPAIAQGKRDLRVGTWGGEFGNLSPVIRSDIQGSLATGKKIRVDHRCQTAAIKHPRGGNRVRNKRSASNGVTLILKRQKVE